MLHACQRSIAAGVVATFDRGARQGQFQLQCIVCIAALGGGQRTVLAAGADVHEQGQRGLPPGLAGAGSAVACYLRGQALQGFGQAIQALQRLRARAGTKGIQCIALLHQGLAQIQAVAVGQIGQRGGGLRIQAACAFHVVGVVQSLCRLGQQQLGLIALYRLAALVGAVGQLGQVLFQQCTALRKAQHLVAQHAVGGRRILQALAGRALVAAQCIQRRLQALQLHGRGLCLRFLFVLLLLPDVPAGIAAHAKHDHPGQRQQPAHRSTGRGNGRSLVHGASLSAAATSCAVVGPAARTTRCSPNACACSPSRSLATTTVACA